MRQYVQSRDEYLENKAKQRELHQKVKKLKERNAPAHDLQESVFIITSYVTSSNPTNSKLKRQLKRADGERERKKAALQEQFRQMNRKRDAADKIVRGNPLTMYWIDACRRIQRHKRPAKECQL